MMLRLYDRLKDEVSIVETRDPGVLTAYVCGPTVYGRIHVGNARPYWFSLVLKRFCEQRLGLQVRLAINITDINDSIYRAAGEQGIPSEQLAREMTDAYLADTGELGLGRPDVEPLATETVPEIIDLIERLIAAGAAYESDGDVYFGVATFPSYGLLSGQRPDELLAGARVEPGERKRSPLDFALWKATKPDEDTSWPSPWGDGRPGWHIECSAMAELHLGLGFDVHGGGLDLVFPHHENERAQTEACGCGVLARRWLHNGMLRLQDAKMSKSKGNVERLHDALERLGGPETLLMFFAAAHYRSPVDYSDDALDQARASARGLREALRGARRALEGAAEGSDAAFRELSRGAVAAFDQRMADDLDTPRALAVLHGLAGAINSNVASPAPDGVALQGALDALLTCLDVLGLSSLGVEQDVPPQVLELADSRERARRARDFVESDRLRDEIASLGFVVRDTASGPQVVSADA